MRAKNTHLLHALMTMDAGVSPTAWQRSTVPALFRDRVHAIHDGVDTALIRPNPQAGLHLHEAGRHPLRLTRADPVISFINRNFEPNRGYHVFMRTLPEILRRGPRAQVVLVGGDGVSYGAKTADGRSWRDMILDEVARSSTRRCWRASTSLAGCRTRC